MSKMLQEGFENSFNDSEDDYSEIFMKEDDYNNRVNMIKKWMQNNTFGASTNWQLNNDMSIDVFCSISVQAPIPDYIQFNFIKGGFKYGPHINITSLKGCPKRVYGGFDCCGNKNLKSLQYGPTTVTGSYWCSGCDLENFRYAPKHIGRDFTCYGNNNLKTFEYFPDVKRNVQFSIPEGMKYSEIMSEIQSKFHGHVSVYAHRNDGTGWNRLTSTQTRLLEGFDDSFNDDEDDFSDTFAGNDDKELYKIELTERIKDWAANNIMIPISDYYTERNRLHPLKTRGIDKFIIVRFIDDIPYLEIKQHLGWGQYYKIKPNANGVLPDYIHFKYIESHVKLDKSFKSLKGFEEAEIEGDFDCSKTQITDFKYVPKSVFGNFDCSDTNIKSLKGLSKCALQYIICRNTKIKDLKGFQLPWWIRAYLDGSTNSNNDIDDTGIWIDLSHNPELESLDGIPVQIWNHVKIDRSLQDKLISDMQKAQQKHEDDIADAISLKQEFSKRTLSKIKSDDNLHVIWNMINALTPPSIDDNTKSIYIPKYNITVVVYRNNYNNDFDNVTYARRNKNLVEKDRFAARIYQGTSSDYRGKDLWSTDNNSDFYVFYKSDKMDMMHKWNNIRKSIYEIIKDYIGDSKVFESFSTSFNDNEDDYADVMNSNDTESLMIQIMKKIDNYLKLLDYSKKENVDDIDTYPFNLNTSIDLTPRLRIKFKANYTQPLTNAGYDRYRCSLKPTIWYNQQKWNDADLWHPYKKIADWKFVKSLPLITWWCLHHNLSSYYMYSANSTSEEFIKNIRDNIETALKEILSSDILLESFDNSFEDNEEDYTNVMDGNDRNEQKRKQISEWMENYAMTAGMGVSDPIYKINDDYTITIPGWNNDRPVLKHTSGPGLKIFAGAFDENTGKFPDYIKFKECNGDFTICSSRSINITSLEGIPRLINGNLDISDIKNITSWDQLQTSYPVKIKEKLIIADSGLIPKDDHLKIEDALSNLRTTKLRPAGILDDWHLDPILVRR